MCHKRTVCSVLDCWLSRNGIITTSHQLNSFSLEWVRPSTKFMRLIVRDHQNGTRPIFVTYAISFPLPHKQGSKNYRQGQETLNLCSRCLSRLRSLHDIFYSVCLFRKGSLGDIGLPDYFPHQFPEPIQTCSLDLYTKSLHVVQIIWLQKYILEF